MTEEARQRDLERFKRAINSLDSVVFLAGITMLALPLSYIFLNL